MDFGFVRINGKILVKYCVWEVLEVSYAKNPKAEYGSSPCRNQANVYKSRNKNKVD